MWRKFRKLGEAVSVDYYSNDKDEPRYHKIIHF